MSSLEFVAPERLLLLVGVAALAVAAAVLAVRRRRRRQEFASEALLPSVQPTSPGWRRPATTALLLAGLVLAVVGVAQPQVLGEQARERSVVLVTLDTSTSMLAEDVEPNRFAAAVEAASEFVGTLPEHVEVGLVAYDARVRLVSAPTSAHGQVLERLQGLDMSGGTALGEAVFIGLASLPPEFRTGPQGEGPPAARIVVLSDGGSTTGRPVSEAASLASEYGVPVSTIAYGTDAGVVVQDGRTFPVPVDEAVLEQLATSTGGTAYTATDTGQLQQVYDDLGSRLASETARRELTAPVTGMALAALLGAAGLGLLWGGRLA